MGLLMKTKTAEEISIRFREFLALLQLNARMPEFKGSAVQWNWRIPQLDNPEHPARKRHCC